MKLSFFKGELVKASSLVFLASLSANLIVFIANIFFLNQLSPENFGILKTTLYLFSFLPVMIEFGISVSLTKYIAEFRSNGKRIGYLIRWFLKLRVFSYLILIFLIFMFREQITFLFFKDSSLIFPGILLIGLSFFNVFQFIALGYQRFKIFAASQFLTLAISSLLGILLIPAGNFYIILGWSLGPLIGNLFAVKFFFEKNILKAYKEFDVKKIFLKFSIPIYFINIPTALSSIIVPLLSLFFSQQLIGQFSFAFIFYSATLLIPGALASVIFPKVSELNGLKKYADAKKLLRKALVLYSFVAIIGILIVFLLSDWFILFFKNYLPSLFMFKILIILGLTFGYNAIYSNYLQGLGKIKKYALLTLIQNILLIFVSFIILSNMI
jgi:O-antigen/teichoic acid export membrane protein